MCLGAKAPPPVKASEPLKNVDQNMTQASSNAEREQRLKAGFAGKYNRYDSGVDSSGKADKLGG